MILAVFTDANRGVSFAGKPFVSPDGIKAELARMKSQLPDKEIVEYDMFKGDWTQVEHVVIFHVNKVYPADRIFKFPANYRYLITNAFNFAADGEVYTAEVFRRG